MRILSTVILLVLATLLTMSVASATVTSVTLSYPNNDTYAESTPEFDFTAISDADATFSCEVFVDGTGAGVNATTANNTLTSITSNTTFSAGEHYWLVSCTDTDDTLNSSTFNFTVDNFVGPGETQVTNVDIRDRYIFTGDNVVDTDAGNITYVDLDTNMSTNRWAGLLGNATGNIILGDNFDNFLFSWSAQGRNVYVAENHIGWSNLEENYSAAFATFYNGASDQDNFTKTFSGTGPLSSDMFTFGSNVQRATTLPGGSGWYTYALNDGKQNVFAGNIIAAGAAAYDGSSVQYQMIVPEYGLGGDTSATEYNLWLELQ